MEGGLRGPCGPEAAAGQLPAPLGRLRGRRRSRPTLLRGVRAERAAALCPRWGQRSLQHRPRVTSPWPWGLYCGCVPGVGLLLSRSQPKDTGSAGLGWPWSPGIVPSPADQGVVVQKPPRAKREGGLPQGPGAQAACLPAPVCGACKGRQPRGPKGQEGTSGTQGHLLAGAGAGTALQGSGDRPGEARTAGSQWRKAWRRGLWATTKMLPWPCRAPGRGCFSV